MVDSNAIKVTGGEVDPKDFIRFVTGMDPAVVTSVRLFDPDTGEEVTDKVFKKVDLSEWEAK